MLQAVSSEIMRLCRLNHANINAFLGVCMVDKATIVFVFPYCQKGDLGVSGTHVHIHQRRSILV
jgi:serine/threonine protein kinase